MKKLLFISVILSITTCAFASVKDLECVADLTKNDYSRRVHLEYNEESGKLEGYRGAYEVGGILFTVESAKNESLLLKMSQEDRNGENIIASKKISAGREVRLEKTLTDGFKATLVCF